VTSLRKIQKIARDENLAPETLKRNKTFSKKRERSIVGSFMLCPKEMFMG
jgi:hypothetical protein